MTSKIELDDTTGEAQVVRAPVGPDPLKAVRVLKRWVRVGIYVAISGVVALNYLLLGYTPFQLGAASAISYFIATVALEMAFAQAFKLRKRSAYPGIVLAELGRGRHINAAAQDALAVLHRLLALRSSFIALLGDGDSSLVSVSGMSGDTAERLIQGGRSDIQEAMRTQTSVPFRLPGLVLPETMPASDERIVFVPVIALQQPIGVLALVGRKGNGDLKDDQLLGGIGNALGLSLQNLSQGESLRQSEEKFRDLVENTSDVLWEMDESGVYTYCSPNVDSILGYEPEELIGKTPFDFMPPEEAKRVGDLFGTIAAGRKPFSLLAHQTRYKDGRLGVMECSGRPVFDEHGRWAGYRGVDRDITDRKRAEEALRGSEARFRALVESAFEGIVISENGKILEANEPFARMFGYELPEVIGMSASDATTPESAELIMKNIQSGFEKPYEIAGVKKDGTIFNIEVVGKNCLYQGRDARVTAFRDITEIKRAEEALKESEAQFRTLADTVAAATFIFQETKMCYVNPAAEAVTGYTQDELLAMDFWDIIHSDFQDLVKERGLARQQGGDVPARYEVKIVTKSGEERWVDFTAGAIEFEGKPAVLGTAFDITERRRAEETIKHLAYHDGLTDLPNRSLFEDRLAVALAQARRKKQMSAVMFLDLDRFKVVNDTVGHALGDRLLQGVAERLMGLVRDGDTVARVGGDEFTLLLPDVAGPEDTVEVAERILDALRQPWVLNGHEFRITTSIGIAMYPNDGEDVESLLRNADTAMYRAKDGGRDNYKLYTPTMNARIAERLALENSLRHGLERGEFVVYYQPQVDISSGRIVGMEALVRWQHPERGLISPAEFIPVAEETGLIVPLGAWVLRTACAQNTAWQEAGVPPMRMAVNLSARQFQLRDLIDTVAQVLEETGLDPQFLQLEITEGVAMQDVEFTVMMLRELREMGVQIAMDDFGTGHSSLSYLKRFPINILRIDQSFVRDLTVDPDDASIASTVIMMAHNLKLKVIAEGVETEDQLAFLRERKCDEMQGYLFSKPAPAEAFEAMLRQGGNRPRARRPVRAKR